MPPHATHIACISTHYDPLYKELTKRGLQHSNSVHLQISASVPGRYRISITLVLYRYQPQIARCKLPCTLY
jgi:hypothetical protein